MPRIHAVADGLRIHAITLCRFGSMRFPVPIINFFTLCYWAVEGVFDPIALGRARQEAHFSKHEGCEADCSQSAHHQVVSASRVHHSSSLLEGRATGNESVDMSHLTKPKSLNALRQTIPQLG